MIEINESDNIYKEIEFLDYDTNYIDRGYIIYDDAECASGRIINKNEYEFEHDIPTDNGSSGRPTIL